jgi:hypothetical protein
LNSVRATEISKSDSTPRSTMNDPDKGNALNLMRPKNSGPASEDAQLLAKLLRSGLIRPRTLDALPDTARAQLAP